MDAFKLFVITPFEGNAGRVWSEALVPAVSRVNALQDYDVLPTRADFDLKGLEFRKHLHEHLNGTDICLCDITGANPNVMYEIGYADARGKETIVIRQEGEEIPIDLSHKYIQSYKSDRIPALSLFLEIAIGRAIETNQAERLSTRPAYDVRCFKDREASDLGRAIGEANDRIDILETNVSTVSDTYVSELQRALTKNKRLTVRVLTLDPDSSFVNNRAGQLGAPIGQYREELHDSIQRLLTQLEPFGERITVRIYDDFPTQITFIVDDAVFSCSIARASRSRHLCTFRVHTYDPGAERTFQFHFEAVWGFGEVYVPFRRQGDKTARKAAIAARKRRATKT